MSEIRVVLVDDEPLLRHGLRMILEGAPGISVIGEAGNGKEGIELILGEEPDVVLMDIRMPVMDGIEATAQLHSLAGARDIPVVMLTLSLIHISEPTRREWLSRMPSSA